MFEIDENIISRITEYDIVKGDVYIIEGIKDNGYLFIRGVKGSYNSRNFISLQKYRKQKLEKLKS
jgi:hypothetical protein